MLHGAHLLIDLTDLEAADGLEKAGSVVGSGECGVLKQLLGDLAVELGAGGTQVALDVDQLLQLVKSTVHLQHRHLAGS